MKRSAGEIRPAKVKIAKDDAKAWRKEALRLRHDLKSLVCEVQIYIAHVDDLMKQPATVRRGQLQGKAINYLEMAVDKARHFGLGESLRKVSPLDASLAKFKMNQESQNFGSDEFVVDGVIIFGLQIGTLFVCKVPINVNWKWRVTATTQYPWAVLMNTKSRILAWTFAEHKDALAFADEFMLYCEPRLDGIIQEAGRHPASKWVNVIATQNRFVPFEWGRQHPIVHAFDKLDLRSYVV